MLLFRAGVLHGPPLQAVQQALGAAGSNTLQHYIGHTECRSILPTMVALELGVSPQGHCQDTWKTQPVICQNLPAWISRPLASPKHMNSMTYIAMVLQTLHVFSCEELQLQCDSMLQHLAASICTDALWHTVQLSHLCNPIAVILLLMEDTNPATYLRFSRSGLCQPQITALQVCGSLSSTTRQSPGKRRKSASS